MVGQKQFAEIPKKYKIFRNNKVKIKCVCGKEIEPFRGWDKHMKINSDCKRFYYKVVKCRPLSIEEELAPQIERQAKTEDLVRKLMARIAFLEGKLGSKYKEKRDHEVRKRLEVDPPVTGARAQLMFERFLYWFKPCILMDSATKAAETPSGKNPHPHYFVSTKWYYHYLKHYIKTRSKGVFWKPIKNESNEIVQFDIGGKVYLGRYLYMKFYEAFRRQSTHMFQQMSRGEWKQTEVAMSQVRETCDCNTPEYNNGKWPNPEAEFIPDENPLYEGEMEYLLQALYDEEVKEARQPIIDELLAEGEIINNDLKLLL